MSTVSVIIPVYNVERFVERSLRSVLNQTFVDYEIVVVDDGGTDRSIDICRSVKDDRIRIIHQQNRGLAGARNAGIRSATGKYIALLDSDDLWHVDKLKLHVAHLESNPDVGVSYSGSAFIDENDQLLGMSMAPQLTNISTPLIFCRNPVGNGSAPVFRREVFDDLAFPVSRDGRVETCYFDENFRYGEDIECWMRIACQTGWAFEGIEGDLTLYRIVSGGLSSNTDKMYEYWNRMYEKVRLMAPELVDEHGARARGYQIRYYARRAVKERQGRRAMKYFFSAMRVHPFMLFEEPKKTMITGLAAVFTSLLPKSA
jgi:glycosyltransferase involved in cell wall biosynthesis